jgi:hypothetical protein
LLDFIQVFMILYVTRKLSVSFHCATSEDKNSFAQGATIF